jgi:hypothetical protein
MAAFARASGIDRPMGFLGRSVLDDARDAATLEAIPALEELELDEERESDHLALQALDELDRPADRAAGREQIVNDQDLLAWPDRIAMNLEGI